MKKYYIGIDIGANGGVFVIDQDGLVIDVFKTPPTRMEFVEKMKKYTYQNCFCILEHVHCQPKHGGRQNFTFGETKERVLFTLEICKIPYLEVTPQTWMKSFMMKKEKEETNTQWKNRLKEKAKQLFPNETITLWNSDAALICFYCRNKYQ